MSRFQATTTARISWEQRNQKQVFRMNRSSYDIFTQGLPWHKKLVLTTLLENQLLMNEVVEDVVFNRLSFALILRIFNPRYFSAWDWVSIQSLLSPNDLIYWEKGTKMAYESALPRSKLFKTKCSLNITSTHTNKLDAEVELINILADEIREEILTEIINDIRTSVRKTIEWDYSPADFEDVLRPICKKYKNMNVLSADTHFWIITNLNTAEDLCEFGTISPNYGSPIGHGKFGTYDGWDVYIDPNSHNEVLLGCKDSSLGSGYCYAPYIPMVLLPDVPTPITTTPQKSFMMRYSKSWRWDAHKYFTRVVFKKQ